MTDAVISNPYIRTALDWCDDFFEGEEMWPALAEALLPSICAPSERRDALVASELAGARFVLLLTANEAERAIKSGDFHVYRGTPSLSGHSLKRIAMMALEQIYENEWLSYVDYEKRLRDLDVAVAESG